MSDNTNNNDNELDALNEVNDKVIEEPKKPIKHLVLDAAPLLTQAPIRGLADHYYTTPQVMNELRDQKSKDYLNMLEIQGVHIEVVSPDAISYAKVSSFSKLTGDYSVLSSPDMGILALTYSLEVKENGTWRLRETPGKSASNESSKVVTNITQSSNQTTTEASNITKKMEETSLNDSSSQQPKEDEFVTVTKGSSIVARPKKFNQKNEESQSDFGNIQVDDESGDEDESDNDAGEWITPDNVEEYKAVDLGHQTPIDKSQKSSSKKPPVVLKAACMTADYAMQNVIIQIGLNLVGTNGKRIRSAKSWVLRCHACFKLCKDQSKKFCPSCGNSTLLRTSITTYAPASADAAPVVKVHLKKNFQYKNRGTKYSIPLPKVGSSRTGSGTGLVLREDDAEWQRSVHNQEVTKRKEEKAMNKALEKGKNSGFSGQWMDPDWLPGLLAPETKGRRSGGKGQAQIGYGRRNPNEVRRGGKKRK